MLVFNMYTNLISYPMIVSRKCVLKIDQKYHVCMFVYANVGLCYLCFQIIFVSM